MCIKHFNSLDFYEKLKIIWSKGVFMDTYITKHEYIKCYSVNLFFVEVVYDENIKEILDIRPFVSGHALDKYVLKLSGAE